MPTTSAVTLRQKAFGGEKTDKLSKSVCSGQSVAGATINKFLSQTQMYKYKGSAALSAMRSSVYKCQWCHKHTQVFSNVFTFITKIMPNKYMHEAAMGWWLSWSELLLFKPTTRRELRTTGTDWSHSPLPAPLNFPLCCTDKLPSSRSLCNLPPPNFGAKFSSQDFPR